MQSRAYLGRFNFKGGDQQKLVGRSLAVNEADCIWPKHCFAGGNVAAA